MSGLRPPKPFNWEIWVPSNGHSAYGRGWVFSAVPATHRERQLLSDSAVPGLIEPAVGYERVRPITLRRLAGAQTGIANVRSGDTHSRSLSTPFAHLKLHLFISVVPGKHLRARPQPSCRSLILLFSGRLMIAINTACKAPCISLVFLIFEVN